MRITQSLHRQSNSVVGLALLCTTAVVALVLAWHYHLGVPATTIGIIGGVPGLYFAWVALRDGKGTSLVAIADQLAAELRSQWLKEDEVRQLNDPYPLSVRWIPADPALVDSWSSVKRLATDGVGWPSRPAADRWVAGAAGLAGGDKELADVLARVPTRRLIVLGEPGAGKTMLLVGLVLDLLARRETEGGPVPVLASLASWDPVGQNLREWLASQVIAAHPSLITPPPPGVGGVTSIHALLEQGLILPVLDGFDEIPVPLRVSAITGINTALRPGEGLVLTSRGDAYRDAVLPAGRVPVTVKGAAGIELCPLDTATVSEYLGQDAGEDRWFPVLEVLGTAAPAARALTTPLMVGLARAIYNPRPGTPMSSDGPNPAELCSTACLPTRADVERRLLDAFIPATYRPEAARRSRWTARQAERYLVFLARHLDHDLAGTTDLAWWELQSATSPKLVAITVALVAGLAGAVFGGLGTAGHTGGFVIAFAVGAPVALIIRFRRKYSGGNAWGLVAGLAGGMAGGSLAGLASGLSGGITDGLAVGYWVGLVGGPIGGLAGGLLGGIASGLVGGLKAGVVGAAADGIAGGVAAGLWAGLEGRRTPAYAPGWSPVGLVLGLIAGLGGGLLAGFVYGLRAGLAFGAGGGAVIAVLGGLAAAPANPKPGATPTTVLVRDRRTFVAVGLAAGLIIGLSVGLVTRAEGGIARGVEAALAFSIGVGLAAGSVRAVWGAFTITRSWLALRRRLPVRLNAFLIDAHRRRVLRQVGAVYQFRHEELQRHLATKPWPS
jgi:hypothetical protein